MKVNSLKQKGKRLETFVSTRINEVLGSYGITAKRMPMSGSIPDWKSDIYTKLPISVECKNQETVKLWEWWKQCRGQSGDKIPILVINRNRENAPMAILNFEDILFFMELAIQAGWLKDHR